MATAYPLLFGRRDLVEGNGFVASVALRGRALLTEEDGAYWIEGVNPGGFAARGGDRGEALAAFGQELRAVLFDIAVDAQTFEAFKAEVEKFFHETSEPARQEWEEAVREVRAGKVEADWLKQRPAESPLSVDVVLIRQPKAANNQEGELAIAA